MSISYILLYTYIQSYNKHITPFLLTYYQKNAPAACFFSEYGLKTTSGVHEFSITLNYPNKNRHPNIPFCLHILIQSRPIILKACSRCIFHPDRRRSFVYQDNQRNAIDSVFSANSATENDTFLFICFQSHIRCHTSKISIDSRQRPIDTQKQNLTPARKRTCIKKPSVLLNQSEGLCINPVSDRHS